MTLTSTALPEIEARDPDECPACGCYACEYEHCGCLCEACRCHLGVICDLGISDECDECGDATITITEPPPSTVRTQVCAACYAETTREDN